MELNMSKRKLTNQDYIDISNYYQNGSSILILSNQYKVSRAHISRILKKEGIPIKIDRLPKAVNKLSNLDKNTLLYWTGFLLADGHISKATKQIRLLLAEIDTAHIEKYKKFFGLGHKIYTEKPSIINISGKEYISTNKVGIQFRNKDIYNWLQQCGVTEYKSTIVNLSDECKNSRDFWRGFIDGDGCIWLSKKYLDINIEAVGIESVLNDFKNFILKQDPYYKGNVRLKKLPMYTIRASSRVGIKMVKLLYQPEDELLDRKYERIKQYFITAENKSRNKAGKPKQVML